MTLAVTLTIEELETLVRRAARDAVDDALEAAPVRIEPQMLTRAQVAKLLSVHPKVVTRWVAKRGLPGSRIGEVWRFEKSKVLRWLAAQRASKES